MAFQISKPTTAQLKHDAWVIVSAFIAAGLTAWQIQPDKFSKSALIAVVTAGVAAVITVGKSIITTF